MTVLHRDPAVYRFNWPSTLRSDYSPNKHLLYIERALWPKPHDIVPSQLGDADFRLALLSILWCSWTFIPNVAVFIDRRWLINTKMQCQYMDSFSWHGKLYSCNFSRVIRTNDDVDKTGVITDMLCRWGCWRLWCYPFPSILALDIHPTLTVSYLNLSTILI